MLRAGVFVDGQGLHPTAKGARVTWENGDWVVTDGPFAEAKEYLGGFWIIEAADLDEALAIAARGSAACAGKVEVRPFDAA